MLRSGNTRESATLSFFNLGLAYKFRRIPKGKTGICLFLQRVEQ